MGVLTAHPTWLCHLAHGHTVAFMYSLHPLQHAIAAMLQGRTT